MTATLEGAEWSAARPGRFTPGKDPVPILQEAGWAPGLVWTGGKSHPHQDSILDCPAGSQSLYQLSYPAHIAVCILKKYKMNTMSFPTVGINIMVETQSCEVGATNCSNKSKQ
jgi:hypothetical protein